MCSDVDLPANVNDSDIWPEMEQPPVPKPGWTSMTFSLINIELSRAMQRLAAVAAASSSSAPPSEEVRVQILQDASQHAEKWLVYCNPVIPPQRLTLYCTRYLLRKLSFVTRLQWILLQQRAGIHADFATEENLTEALAVLEPKLYEADGLLNQFAWTRRAYPQYHVTMYVLLHLCVKPEGPGIDKAWKAVDSFFEDETGDRTKIGFGSKLSVLSVLRSKAVAAREKLQNRRPPVAISDGNRVLGMVSGEASAQCAGPSASLQGDAPGHGFGLDAGLDTWPDWAMLVQDFQLDPSDVFMQ